MRKCKATPEQTVSTRWASRLDTRCVARPPANAGRLSIIRLTGKLHLGYATTVSQRPTFTCMLACYCNPHELPSVGLRFYILHSSPGYRLPLFLLTAAYKSEHLTVGAGIATRSLRGGVPMPAGSRGHKLSPAPFFVYCRSQR